MQAEQQSERERFDAWKLLDNPRYQPTDDSMQDRRDWKLWQAALSHPSPQGWKLVPVEPTSNMLAAMSGEWHSSRHAGARKQYAAMLDAAPPPPEQGSKG